VILLNIAAIFAHPDDLSFYSGSGTLARWVEEGHSVFTICATNGEVGTLRRDLTKEQVAEKRLEELKVANKILGIDAPILLNYPDAGFINGPELREKLVYYVRKLRADRVMTLDPWTPYEVHPDHIMVGHMAAEAASFASFPLLYPDQLIGDIEPYSCSEVWFMGFLGHQPNCYVDISSTLEKKMTALLKYEGSLEILAKLFAPDIDPANVTMEDMKKLTKFANRLLRSMASVTGKKVNLKAAEAFFVQFI